MRTTVLVWEGLRPERTHSCPSLDNVVERSLPTKGPSRQITLPNGDNNFRGATIDYHAWTGESTIIGTIHIVNDSGEEHISHSEVQSGSSDGENDDLWVVLNEGTVSYRRVDGESKTLKIQWTAKVFYGSELYD